jgi:hypothetical protein
MRGGPLDPLTVRFASLDAQIAAIPNNGKRRRLRKELERARGKVELRAEVASMRAERLRRSAVVISEAP